MGETATLVAIVKDELPYLIEWVAYHRLIGFDRLVLYSNDCSDGTDGLLDRMQELGLATHRRWPSPAGVSPQHAAYVDAFRSCDTDWFMALDADEFLNLARASSVAEFVQAFPDEASAVAICWRVFGSSGQLWRGPQPVTQRFTWAAAAGHHLNRHIKSLLRVAAVDTPGIHAASLKRGHFVLPTGEPYKLHRDCFAEPRYDVAQVNHYVVKSREEFEAKLARGNANLPPGHPMKETSRPSSFFEEHDRNEVVDTSILRWRDALKTEMRSIATRLSALGD